MVEEIRDGLADTVAAHTDEGLPYGRAVRLWLRVRGVRLHLRLRVRPGVYGRAEENVARAAA